MFIKKRFANWHNSIDPKHHLSTAVLTQGNAATSDRCITAAVQATSVWITHTSAATTRQKETQQKLTTLLLFLATVPVAAANASQSSPVEKRSTSLQWNLPEPIAARPASLCASNLGLPTKKRRRGFRTQHWACCHKGTVTPGTLFRYTHLPNDSWNCSKSIWEFTSLFFLFLFPPEHYCTLY